MHSMVDHFWIRIGLTLFLGLAPARVVRAEGTSPTPAVRGRPRGARSSEGHFLGAHELLDLARSLTPAEQANAFLEIVGRRGGRWTSRQKQFLLQNFLKNSDGSYSGAVWASPSSGRPGNARLHDVGEANYRYNWTRDSAVVTGAVVDLLSFSDTTAAEKQEYWKLLKGYVSFSRETQNLPITHEWLKWGPDGAPQFVAPGTPGAIPYRYGEAKYEVVKVETAPGQFKWVPGDFKEGWGRPQNDGPALRATTLSKIANALLDKKASQGGRLNAEDEALLRDAVLGAKEDLKFVQARWRDPSFDLWEEVVGHHFFTRVAQSEAMENGIALLERLKSQDGLLKTLKEEHAAIESEMPKFWRGDRGYIASTLDRNPKIGPQKTDEDVATVMAALRRNSGPFSVRDPRVQATVAHLYDVFRDYPPFPFNREKGLPGLAFGRYPGDAWTGRERGKPGDGHPWVITTLAMAQAFYDVARGFRDEGKIAITPENQRFFEIVMGGKALPAHVKQALATKRSLVISEKTDPALFTEILTETRNQGLLIAARIPATGISISRSTPEQFEQQGNHGRAVGVVGLAWNCAAYLGGLVKSYRELHARGPLARPLSAGHRP